MEQQPNGDSTAGPSRSPFSGLSLAVDAYTLDTAGGKRKLREIKADGTLDYDNPQLPSEKRTEELWRIWREFPGGFGDITEAELRAAAPDKVWQRESEVDQEEDNLREAGELMSVKDMSVLREGVIWKLNEALQQLWPVCNLARCLRLSADMKSDPPPEPILTTKKSKPAPREALPDSTDFLPPGAFSTTVATPYERTKVEEAQALETAIATQAAALDDCVALVDAAVDELRLMNTAGERWSNDIRRLHMGESGNGQWAVVPKPDFYRSRAKVAQDVVIPYALDEAPAILHIKSLAAFDLDPRKADLAFNERTYRRLRVRLRRGGPGGPQDGSSIYDARNEGNDPADLLAQAQLETLDADLFEELRAEAWRLRFEAAVVEPTNVMLAFGREKLIFQLYDTREKPSPTVPYSPVCDALLAAGRLGLLQSYKKRKEHLIALGSAGSANASTSTPPASPILVPIVHCLQFRATCRAVKEVLAGFAAALVSAGLTASLEERHAVADGPDALLALLAAQRKVVDVLGAVFTIELSRCPGMSVNITAPNQVTVVTPKANFPLRDVDSLSGIVGDTITEQLSVFAFPMLRDAAGEDGGVFFDELDGVAVAGLQGPISISFPSPQDRLLATTGEGTTYDSSNASQSFEEWLIDLGRGLSATEDS